MCADKCVFCSIMRGDVPCVKVHEDAAVVAFLDIGPISEGHTLVVPKMHCETLDQCPADVLAQVVGLAAKIAPAVVSAVQAEGYNLLCNNGRAAGQLVGHLHFHLIPRHTQDGVFARWPAGKYLPGRAEEIAAKIREKL
ncbi:MAG TPA: HIT family protein [Anaerohalosphaeraceae bacterium]|jgi:histidine triad (HIT) family protein|nr:HIT family protein [Anaerohalosphaeraceae bacterium]HRT49211.1 HIT family protein [Anaerohalosphaeraceae bacterium]HRT85250.1 HIT family protein [Anaerohalosphaeraceae bacterium]